MEGSWTEIIRPEQSFLFPTLLQLSREEIMAIWDAVSTYIMEEMIQDKGVLIVGLGTFGTFREVQVSDTGKRLVTRRPVFQMDRDADWLRGLKYHRVTLPVNLEIRQLDMERLSRGTPYSWQVVEGCVEETMRLFSSHVRRKENVAFTFGDVGVLARQQDKVHMEFSKQCARRLEAIENLISALRRKLQLTELPLYSRPAPPQRSQPSSVTMFPRFQLSVRGSRQGLAFPMVFPQKKELKEERGGTGSSKEQRPGKVRQHRKDLSLPRLPHKEEGGRRQQNTRMKTEAEILVEELCPIQGTSLLKEHALEFTLHPPMLASGRVGCPPRAAGQPPARPATWRLKRDPMAALREEKLRQHQAPYEERQAAQKEEARRLAQISLQKQLAQDQWRKRVTNMLDKTSQRQESRLVKQNVELFSSYKVLRDRWKKRVEVNRKWLKKAEEYRAKLIDRQSREKDRVPGSQRHQVFHAWK